MKQKKQYQKPKMTVFKLKHQQHLLVGSGAEPTYNPFNPEREW